MDSSSYYARMNTASNTTNPSTMNRYHVHFKHRNNTRSHCYCMRRMRHSRLMAQSHNNNFHKPVKKFFNNCIPFGHNTGIEMITQNRPIQMPGRTFTTLSSTYLPYHHSPSPHQTSRSGPKHWPTPKRGLLEGTTAGMLTNSNRSPTHAFEPLRTFSRTCHHQQYLTRTSIKPSLCHCAKSQTQKMRQAPALSL